MSSVPTLGSMAAGFQMRRAQLSLRDGIDRHKLELATGAVRDPSRALRGDLGRLAMIETGLNRSSSQISSITQSLDSLAGGQAALEQIQQIGERLQDSLIGLSEGAATDLAMTRAADQAAADLQQMISALATSRSGRGLFSGATTDQAPLPDAGVLLAGVISAIPPGSSAADVFAAVDSYVMAVGGPFETAIYSGSGNLLLMAPPSQEPIVLPDASHPAIRLALRDAALVAVLGDASLFADQIQRQELAGMARARHSESAEALISLRAEIGSWQGALSGNEETLRAERDDLHRMRDALIGVDPFTAATRLEEARTRLEALYLVTARVARLNLADYLR